jgi:hypothetical protein
MKPLEDDTNMIEPESRALASRERAGPRPDKPHDALGRNVQRRNEMQERGFATAARPRDPDELTT